MRRGGAFALAGLLLLSASVQGAQTPGNGTQQQTVFSSRTILGNGNGEMLLKADHVDYDLNTGVATATGNVEINYNGRTLLADRVVSDKKNDTVTASGHVVIMAPNGDVVFAEQARLSDRMKDGVIESFSALIGQNGRLVAARATRIGGVRTIASNAAYTPCKICNQPGQRTPDWEVLAPHVVYDEIHHRINYTNAEVKLEGIPVLYTPFFSNADPTVKHQTGLLMPDLGSKSTLGYYARLPYYIAFNDSQDMTLAPLFSTFGGEQLEGEYRQRWDDGGMWLQGSIANDPHAGSRENLTQNYGSLFGAGTIPIDNIWHFGYQAQLTSYASYLQRYSISDSDRLNNDLFIEALDGRSRFAITGYFFQGLRTTDDNNLFPVALPLIEYNYIPRQDVFGGDFRFDLSTIAISRHAGEDDQRLTGNTQWSLPFVTGDGQLITFRADARGDVYHTDNVNAFGDTGLSDSQYITRGAPYAALDWRWPFVSPGAWGMTGFVVEPIAQVIAAPYGDNPQAIANETGYSILPADSLTTDFQLDATNIFDLDRLNSHDLVESGPNANVGFRSQALFPTGSVDFLLGQAYRLKPDPVFAPDSGYDGKTSDLVSSLVVNFQPNLSLSDRIDVDSSSGTLERNEASVNAVYGRSSLEVSYLKLPSEEVTLGLGAREEVKAQLLLGLWGHWLAYAAGERDLHPIPLEPNAKTTNMISQELGFGYDDECLGFSLSYERNFTEFRELPASSSVLFRFTLKTSEVPAQRSGIFPQHLYAATPL
ncbi:MAG TPA: LPS assembly protein LptD [Rhizomicrobium sp.]|jgi:LPS-assembly protein|nr:LPS assembly protein LptD [Rhizomicrobium sp.]